MLASVSPILNRVLTLSGAVFEQPDLPPLEAVALTGTEAINALFEYRLVVKAAERELGFAPWTVDPALLLDRTLTLNLELEGWGTFIAGSVGNAGLAGQGAGQRQISGVIAEVNLADSDSRHQRVELVIRPGLFEATLAVHSHPFQDMTVVEVLDAILANYPWAVDKRLIETYPSVDLTTQYQETDWHFICRLMQNAGINYHFEHAEGTHRLILSDHNSAFLPIGAEDSPYREIPIHPPGHRIDREYIHAFSPVHRITSTAWESRDYDYTRPRLVRVARAGEAAQEGLNEGPDPATHPRREIALWRGHQSGAGGLWSQPNAGRDAQANAKADSIPRELSRIRLQAQTQHSERATGEGHIRGLAAGHSFHLTGHTQKSANAEHLILSTHITLQAPGQESQGSGNNTSGQWRIHTRFETQPSRLPLRPDLTLRKPVISGSETAVVTGPGGSNPHTDHLGRIKVRLWWDRSGRTDHTSSIWLRYATPWAGNQLGAVFLPRPGQEVNVQFEGGDPDRPIAIRHRLYTLVAASREPVPRELSPMWRGLRKSRFQLPRRIPVWVSALTAAMILLALHTYIQWGLNQQEAKLYATLDEIAAMRPPERKPVKLAELLKAEIATGRLAVTDASDGSSTVTFAGDDMFAPGQGAMAARARPLVERVGQEVARLAAQQPVAVTVTGHSDNVPIATAQFPDNAALSLARAQVVAQAMEKAVAGVASASNAANAAGSAIGKGTAVTVKVEGAGPTQPVADNTTREGRAKNRRVEVKVSANAKDAATPVR